MNVIPGEASAVCYGVSGRSIISHRATEARRIRTKPYHFLHGFKASGLNVSVPLCEISFGFVGR